jgi:hypothetical protein
LSIVMLHVADALVLTGGTSSPPLSIEIVLPA